VPKVKVAGPFPPAAASDVQRIRSAAAKPVPAQLQLGEAGQTAEARLFAPAKPTVTATPPPEVALTLEARMVPSAPSCNHTKESLEFWPVLLVTPVIVSPQAADASNSRTINPLSR
jgi:hypothetical protein